MSRNDSSPSSDGVTKLVDLEELMGHTVAVGEVTQESGQRIGTALRTIYSRVTTHKDSIEVLDELGIAMHTMGEEGRELRGVGEILGELAEGWKDLSAEQQQNYGLAMAGRNRLTQLTINELSHIEMCA